MPSEMDILPPSTELMALPSGEFTDSTESTLKHLLDVHFPGSTIDTPNVANSNTSAVIGSDINIVRQIVTKDRIAWAVNTFSPYKSAGEDGVFPAMLQARKHTNISRYYS